ncbi:DUF3267 domain-containing protein [uncultured Methanofollis sp.]|uniref:DUF3267 domain-containing protein n=1 Tax=uncultured Methanofollis sp. TaxID=262500 RepID=UPI002616661C|nr:DUF3267 domain-containing protein [uncultured Methanofollis sp.]
MDLQGIFPGNPIDPKKYARFRTLTFSGGTSLLLTAWSFILFSVFFALSLLTYIQVTGADSFSFTMTGPSDLLPLIVLIILIPLTGILHEGFHGVAYRLLHRRPAFGWGRRSVLLYCSCSAGGPYTRKESIFILMAPFVLIPAIGTMLTALAPAWAFATIVLLPLNAAGSVADLRAAAAIIRSPPGSVVLEEGEEMAVLVPLQ